MGRQGRLIAVVGHCGRRVGRGAVGIGALLGSVAIGLTGCDRAADTRAAGFTTRDSAGVTVIDNATAEWGTSPPWHVAQRPFLVIGHDADDSERSPLDPASVHRSADGSVVVGDGLSAGLNKLLVFDSLGSFVRSMGREGKGPCEFQQLWWSAPYRGDSIVAYDFANHSITVFGADGKCGRTFRHPVARAQTPPGTYGFSAGADGVYPDGGVLYYPTGVVNLNDGGSTPWYVHDLGRTDADGNAIGALGTFRLMQTNWDGTTQRERPYSPYALKTLDGTDLLYSSCDAYAFARYGIDGGLRQVVRLTLLMPELSAEERREYIDAVTERVRTAHFEGGPEAAARRRASLESVEWPTHKPALSSMIADSLGNVWLREYSNPALLESRADSGMADWHVVRKDGRWLGTVQMSAQFQPERIYADAVYGRWKNVDGTSEVRAYRLTRGKRSGGGDR